MVLLSKRRRFVVGVLIATAIGGVFCLAYHFDLLHGMQLKSNDFLFSAASLHPGAETEKIVIVAIDDKSLDELGHLSSWPRYYHTGIIDVLNRSEARVIVFDILFSEPTPDDEELAAAIRNAGNVVIPFVYTSMSRKPSTIGETIAFGSVLSPLKTLEESAAAVGHANLIPDEDGIVRRVPIAVSSSEQYEPALALSAVAKYLRRPHIIESPIMDKVLPFAGRSIPLDNANSMIINYTSDSAALLSFATVSYADVLRNNINTAAFQDKIVLIGATGAGLGDTFWTPVGRMMNGVEIHASAIQTILTADFLRPSPAVVTFMSILALALLCGLMVLRLRMLWAALGCVFLCIAYFLTTFSLFDNGVVLNMLYPPLAIVGTFVGVNLYNISTERSEKGEITKIFGRFISPPVVDTVLTAMREGELELGGEEQEVTAVFADVRNFTGISERIPPDELVRVLNIYLSTIIDTVLEHNGMINKFGGDSVMALWNVPMEHERHALSATKAAISAQRAIKELQERETTLPKMEFGIGINTGKALAGNMGSEDRLEYSVIGDAVNTASKLANATPGGKIWIGESTYKLVNSHIATKLLEPLAVKGKSQPIQAYEVLDDFGEPISDLQNAIIQPREGQV
jgi:adenylate cyclase